MLCSGPLWSTAQPRCPARVASSRCLRRAAGDLRICPCRSRSGSGVTTSGTPSPGTETGRHQDPSPSACAAALPAPRSSSCCLCPRYPLAWEQAASTSRAGFGCWRFPWGVLVLQALLSALCYQHSLARICAPSQCSSSSRCPAAAQSARKGRARAQSCALASSWHHRDNFSLGTRTRVCTAPYTAQHNGCSEQLPGSAPALRACGSAPSLRSFLFPSAPLLCSRTVPAKHIPTSCLRRAGGTPGCGQGVCRALLKHRAKPWDQPPPESLALPAGSTRSLAVPSSPAGSAGSSQLQHALVLFKGLA